MNSIPGAHTMRARPLLIAFLLLALPAAGHAAAVSPPGVNIRWDRCLADGGVWNRTFACDTNSGTEALVLSFELDAPKTDVSGFEIVVDVASASALLPSWWQFRNVGSCRQTAMTLSTVAPAGSANCVDWSNGQQVGGIGAYVTPADLNLSKARILAAVAVPPNALASLAAQQEYFVASLLIDHSKTVGTGACAGCDVPVCVLFQSLNLTTPVVANNLKLYRGASWQGSQLAYWQNGYSPDPRLVCNTTNPVLGCRWFFSCVPYDVTHARPSTWGSVKALYR